MIWVIAGSYGQYLDYCYDNEINPHKDTFWLSGNPKYSRGRHWQEDDTLVWVGTWRDRTDLRELWFALSGCLVPTELIERIRPVEGELEQ